MPTNVRLWAVVSVPALYHELGNRHHCETHYSYSSRVLRRVPPLEMVETFVAAARANSFRAVARGTALSPSAVSRRIAGLEQFLGVALFDRVGQTVRLNVVGQRYLDLIEPAIGTIRDAARTIADEEAAELHVGTSDSFASCWLDPRLADAQVHCGLKVRVIRSRDPMTIRTGAVDVGIWGGMGQLQGLKADTLFEVNAVPVAAPSAIEGRTAPMQEADIADLSLVGVGSPSGLWERWFALGDYRPATLSIRELPSLQMAYETAAAGFGATLAVPLIAEQLLVDRKLVPIAGPRRIGEAYRVYCADRPLDKVQSRFVDWLRREAAESIARFDRVSASFGIPAAH